MIGNLYRKCKYIFDYSFVVFLAGINSILTYVSSIYINRNLSVEDFAEYNAITSIYSLIILTVSSYSYYIMQNYHSVSEDKKSSYWVYGIVIALIVSFVYILCTPLMPIFFNIRLLNIYLIFASVVFISILNIVPQSVIRANGLLQTEYTINILSNIFVKFLLLGIFILTSFNILKASITIFSYVFSFLIIAVFMLKKNNLLANINFRNLNKYINKDETKNILKTISPILIFNAIFNFIIVFDVLMSIRFLDKEYAGYYATMSIITKIFFYISTNIGGIMYSRLISDNNNNERKEKKTIAISFLFNLAVTTIFAIALYIFGEKFVLIQFTNKYETIIALIPQVILFGFSISITTILFNYCLFYKWYKPFYFYIPLVISVYFALRNNDRTFSMYMHIFKIFFIVLLVYNLFIFIWHLIQSSSQKNSLA